jgi:hypothetical protein
MATGLKIEGILMLSASLPMVDSVRDGKTVKLSSGRADTGSNARLKIAGIWPAS